MREVRVKEVILHSEDFTEENWWNLCTAFNRDIDDEDIELKVVSE